MRILLQFKDGYGEYDWDESPVVELFAWLRQLFWRKQPKHNGPLYTTLDVGDLRLRSPNWWMHEKDKPAYSGEHDEAYLAFLGQYDDNLDNPVVQWKQPAKETP